MLPGYIEAMLEVFELRARGGSLTRQQVNERIETTHGALGQGASTQKSSAPTTIAVIPVWGVISPHARDIEDTSGPPGTAAESVGRLFDMALNDPNVSSIVLDVDSPGGTIGGVPELAGKIFGARGKKKVVASVSGMAASAAYWIATAAEEVAVTPSGEVGSVGVYMVHQDFSGFYGKEGVNHTIIKAGKYKAEGHHAEPLTDEAKASLQGRVDESYGLFVNAVAKHRGVKAADVRGGYGEGRVVSAKAALDMGMVDRIATFDEVVARLTSRGGSKPSGRNAAALARELDLTNANAPI